MRDPEELAGLRRATAGKPTEPAPPTDPATAAIAAQVARQDAADRGWRWLVRWRSDRHTFEQIAADEGVQVAEVRAAVDAELRRDGSSIAIVEAEIAERRRRVGGRLGSQKPALRLVGAELSATGGRIAR